MAILSNINDLFRVDSAGAVYFGTSAGTNGQILKSVGTGGSPVWIDQTDITGPFVLKAGDTMTGPLVINGSNSLTVGGTLTGTTATFGGNVDVTGNIIARANASYYATRNYLGETWEFASDTADGVTFKITGGAANTTGNFFKFQTQAGGATPATALTINKNGNVGINTATPQKKFHIEGAGGASEMQILVSSASDTVGHTAGIGLRGEGGEADGDLRIKGGIFFERIAGSFGNGKMILAVNSSVNNTSVTVADHALTIDTNKNVGIGTTGPEHELVVIGTIGFGLNYNGGVYANDTVTGVDENWGLEVQRTANVNDYNTRLKYYPVSGESRAAGIYDSRNARFSLYSDTNNNPNIIIPNGNVGIGVDGPDSRLTVSSGTANNVANFKSSDGTAYIALSDNSSSSALDNQIGVVGDNMYFATGDVERMRITSAGQLQLQGSSSSLAKSTTQTEWAYIPGNTNASLMSQNPSGMSSASAGYHIVYGANGSSPYQAFIDVITYECGSSSTSVTTVSSTNISGSPGSRVYSKTANAVILNISGFVNYNCNVKTTFINYPH